MPLFEVVILEVPTTQEQEVGKEEKIVLDVQRFIAPDEQSAAIDAIEYCKDQGITIPREKRQVLVRPFV